MQMETGIMDIQDIIIDGGFSLLLPAFDKTICSNAQRPKMSLWRIPLLPDSRANTMYRETLL